MIEQKRELCISALMMNYKKGFINEKLILLIILAYLLFIIFKSFIKLIEIYQENKYILKNLFIFCFIIL
jgi:hypothetical protein